MLSSTLRSDARRRCRTISVAAERRNSRTLWWQGSTAAAKPRQHVAAGVSPQKGGPKPDEPRSGDRSTSCSQLLPPLRGSVDISLCNPRLTPWATCCRRFATESRASLLPVLVLLAVSVGCGSSESTQKPTAQPAAQSSVETQPHAPVTQPVVVADEPAVSPPEPVLPKPIAAEQQFRPTFPQREFRDEQLQRAGLVKYSSGAVRLVTDLPSDEVNSLLGVGTAIAEFWPQRFGELLPAEDGSKFGFTAYVMRDRDLFSDAGLLPQALPLIFHGRQEGSEFWMNDQSRDYYRRHLFLHEATHVFMRHIGGEADDLPLWFLEGMAELVATHVVAEDGSFTFNVYPDIRERFAGLDRMKLLRRGIRENGVRSMEDVTRLQGGDFSRLEGYAWSWALCVFLDEHPLTRDGFREALRNLRERSLAEWLDGVYAVDPVGLEVAWTQFVSHVTYRFDFERTRIAIENGEPLAGTKAFDVRSDRGWQSSGVHVEAGRRYSIESSGQITLADVPKPWGSESDGISFQYVGGLPIGRLMGAVLVGEGDSSTRALSMLEELPLGNRAEFVAPASGTLYLRVNDDWGSLADNRGVLRVTIRQAD